MNNNLPNRYIYWKEEPQERKWKPIRNTEADRQRAIDQGAMFFTWTIFSSPIDGNGAPEPHRWGDLPIDLDRKYDENGNVIVDERGALQEARQLALVHLPELYGVDPYAIRFFVSGGKGFHIEIPATLLAAQDGDIFLPKIYKKMVAE